MRRTFKEVLAEFGTTALVVYLTIFAAVLGGFVIAIRMGLRPESTAGGLGTLAAAWVATKLTQPLRIAATLLVTPLVVKLFRRPGTQPADNGTRDDPGVGRSTH